jgi:hypothetical protein
MEFIFLINKDSSIYWQKGKLSNDILVMEEEFNIKENSDIFKNNNTVSLFDYNETKKNYNLLELTKCNTISSLRYRLFKKRYISSKISNQLVILSDCFIKLINENKIKLLDDLNENELLDDLNENELLDDLNENEEILSEFETKITQTDSNVIKPEENNNYNIVTNFIFYGLGVISGYILKKYRPLF